MDIIGYCFKPNEAFEGRNQAYGAFRLRMAYQRRLLAALAIGSLGFTLGLTAPVLYARLDATRAETIDVSRVVELKNIEAPPLDPKQPPPPPIEAPPPPPKVSTVRFVPPEVAPDEEVPDEEIPPPQEELKEVQASTLTQEGDPNASPDEIIVEDPVNEQAEVVGTGQAEEVFAIVEQMPEFPGGTQALMQFLAKEIKYPEIAKKAGVEGRVFVQFVIGPDGSIRDVAVVRGVGAGCDEEAVRAVRAMPKWIPGKQRGQAVPVRYAMPIVFKLR